ncbi:MAG: HlyD family efflux transporter periplasmic adaptor subunit, partial [Bacillota bacterium]|nr:HlyD family efflux transporter periplasmic adaptor subunit [Bacillota bacterium]
EIEVFIRASEVASIDNGMSIKLTQNRKGENVDFEGTIIKIAPTAVETISALGLTEQRVKLNIDPKTPEELKLFPGYKLDVEFTIDERNNVIVVPKTVLFPYQTGEALWVIRDGVAEIQPVETGFNNDRNIVITSGLVAGDLVILNPQLEGLTAGKAIIMQQ